MVGLSREPGPDASSGCDPSRFSGGRSRLATASVGYVMCLQRYSQRPTAWWQARRAVAPRPQRARG